MAGCVRFLEERTDRALAGCRQDEAGVYCTDTYVFLVVNAQHVLRGMSIQPWTLHSSVAVASPQAASSRVRSTL
jgi:hypothetical protein